MPAALPALSIDNIVCCGIVWKFEVDGNGVRAESEDGKKRYKGKPGEPLRIVV